MIYVHSCGYLFAHTQIITAISDRGHRPYKQRWQGYKRQTGVGAVAALDTLRVMRWSVKIEQRVEVTFTP